jgi:microcystin-dependent protein
MADPFLGEIRMFGGNYAPHNWAFCNGQILDISSNTALFSLLGTAYGGDGRVSFGLPDPRGRVPMSAGQHPGSITNYTLGQKGGFETVTLTTANIPAHTHTVEVFDQEGSDAAIGYLGPNYGASVGTVASYKNVEVVDNSVVNLHASTIHQSGLSSPIHNKQPFVVINFIIALLGTYPPRS